MKEEKKSVMHRIYNGWSFYPITYKGKRYVIEVKKANFKVYQRLFYHVNFFEYKEKKTFFRGHKAKNIYYTSYSDFQFVPNDKECTETATITNIFSKDFTDNFPAILNNIFYDYENKLKEQKATIKNVEWDGVIR